MKTRQQIAYEYGYDNYVDLCYSGISSEYTSGMMEDYFDDVKAHIVPLYEAQAEEGFYYYPDIDMDYGEFMEFARKDLAGLSDSFDETFGYMMDFGLCDLEPSRYKSSGAQTRYIENYDAPFIIGSYTSDIDSMRAFFHEFGHFYNMHVTGGMTGASLDTEEIFSQAVELMSINCYTDYFGVSTGYMMAYDTLVNVFAKIPEESFYADFEREVYLMDDDELTVDNLNRLCEEKRREYGMDFVALPGYLSYDWVTMAHIYEAPFYTFSYVTAADVALQVWEISLEDTREAMDVLSELQDNMAEHDFVKNVENAGLANPFGQGRVKDLARMYKEYLIDEKLLPDIAA